jgi:poly-D-alanine transfer protein DltD
MLFSLFYLGYMTMRMYDLQDDNFTTVSLKNLLDSEEQQTLMLGENNFVPIFQLSKLKNIDEFAISKSKGLEIDIDMDALRRYLVPIVLITSRTNSG